jgi:hypothetical protein
MLKVRSMTGIEKCIEAKKMKDRAEDMEEVMMEAQAISGAMKAKKKKR